MFLAKKLNRGAGTPAPKDAQFNYVTMLLHGDGTNGAQNNTFLDSSTNNFTITRNGNTTQGSFSPYGSNWSNYFGGSDYLSLADNANLNPSTQDFVMEAWVFLTGTTGNNQGINGKGTPGTDGYTFYVTNALVLSFIWNGTGGATITGGTLVLNTWNHVAVVRNSSVIRLYLNGVGAGSSTACTTDITSTATKFVGQARGGNPILGYMSNYRMTKGSLPSGYDATSASLTPPTAPLTAISGTSLLTCQSNRFVDNSTNNFTITVTGTPSVQRFNPFGASTAYSTSVIGGSGYFDGSGDYLATSSTQIIPASTTYTVEAWVYLTGDYSDYREIVTQGSSGNANRWLMLVNITDGILKIQTGASSVTTSFTVPRNTWTHLAFVNNSGSYTVYANGTSVGSGTNTVTPQNTYVTVGAFQSGAEYFQGYISNVRITNTAVYTSAFTPNTAPLTAISGTSLLLNYTNGAIFDNAMISNLETVGTAQISTSVKKYGTGSMYLDGQGNEIICNTNKANISFGTGDFTIECWMYTGSSSGQNMLWSFDWFTGVGGWAFYLETYLGSGLVFHDGTGQNKRSWTWATNTWYHLAVSRSGTSLRLFVDGTQLGSTFTNSNSVNALYDNVKISSNNETYTIGFTGYIDDLRITKGYARYTANFTAPTATLPDIGP